ncbi:MAG: ABC transporter substrate-binding protein [Candidatus Rokuibacteriota bacterium]|nr:MAG: ABC transporter substrate-binding protein [Candidatus Rokubacteria bacterium]
MRLRLWSHTWSSNCLTSSRLSYEALMGRASHPLRRTSNGEDMGWHRGGGRGSRVVLAGGAGNRVGDVQLNAILPGDRDRGRRRGLVFGRLSAVSTSSLSRLRAGRGGMPPPFLFLLLVAAALVCAQPSPLRAQDKDHGPANSVYRRPLGHDPKTLDPARVSDVYSLSISQQIFDGLVQYDNALTIVPALAEFWRASRDGLVWTFTLRRGAKFHHGREVTAEDVVYSFARILDPKTRSGAAELFLNVKGAREFRDGRAKSVSGLVALDRRTVQVTLDESVAPFVAIAAVGHAKIVPRDLVETGETFGAQPVGTGPFKFVRWERGKEIVLEANEEYFDGAPRLSRLVFRIFPGEQRDAMQDEFQKGNLEDAPVPARVDRRELVARGGYIYVKRPMISARFYGFNTRAKPLNDRRIRQAIVQAIDREAIVESVYLGQVAFARGILPPGMLGFNPGLAGYSYNPQRARELLAEAGYPGGRGLPPLAIWSGARQADIVREHALMKKWLAAVGITADFQYNTDWQAFSKLLDEGKLPIFLYAWYADVPDPDNFLSKLFHSKSPRNFFGYANPVVDDLLASARSAGDVQRRVEAYRKAEQLILDDAPIIPVFHRAYERLFQPYVRSVEVNGLGDPYIPLRKIWLERAR